MTNAAQPGEGAQTTGGLAEQAQDLASNLTQTAKARATGLVEEQKAAAADQVEGVARLLDDVAGRVEQGAPAVAPLLREAASSVHRVSSSLRDRSVDDVLQQFGEFARRRPGTVIGASLVSGFVLARFLKSSADRRSSRAQDYSGSSQHRSTGNQQSRGTGARPPVTAERSEASLSDVGSPAAGMSSISDVAPGKTSRPVGTSSAGGGAEAPDQGVI